MSGQPLERAVAAVLASQPGLWAYHPSDAAFGAKTRLPADFIYGGRDGWGLIECKDCATSSMRAARWEEHQRQAALEVRDVGGRYLLLVRFTAVQGPGLFLWTLPWPRSRFIFRPVPGPMNGDPVELESLRALIDHLW